MPWKHSSIPLVFLSLRQDSENPPHRGWLRPGESVLFPQEVCVSPIFSIGTFQLKPRPALHHMLPLQDPSRSESDALLPGRAHLRAWVVTACRRLHTVQEKWAVWWAWTTSKQAQVQWTAAGQRGVARKQVGGGGWCPGHHPAWAASPLRTDSIFLQEMRNHLRFLSRNESLLSFSAMINCKQKYLWGNVLEN